MYALLCSETQTRLVAAEVACVAAGFARDERCNERLVTPLLVRSGVAFSEDQRRPPANAIKRASGEGTQIRI